jgi:hypothetical protein
MRTVPRPIVITISHELGRDEAKRRLDDGLGRIRSDLAPIANSIDYRWAGYRLEFGLTALRMAISGHIDVEDRLLRIEFGLPLLLRMLSGKIVGRIRSEGLQLLGGPAGPAANDPL